MSNSGCMREAAWGINIFRYQAIRSGKMVREMMKIAPALLLLLLLPATLSSQVDEKETGFPFTGSQLQTAIEQTKNENTRLEALNQLIRMAGIHLYNDGGSVDFLGPDPVQDQLQREAAKAAWACRDLVTVDKALDSPHTGVRLWAAWSIPGSNTEDIEPWLPLFPKLVKLLSDPNGRIREVTIRKLSRYPGGDRAVADHIPVETDPQVLMFFAGSGTSPKLYGYLVRILSSTDDKVRENALVFIWSNLWNSATAPMWKLGFNQEVYDRVHILAQSPSQTEKEIALKALIELDRIKPPIPD